MPQIQLLDGKKIPFDKKINGFDLIKKISKSLEKKALIMDVDGNLKDSYSEKDATNPTSTYGHSKLEGERAIKRINCKHIIIRTAWVYSEHGSNFLKTILKLGLKSNNLSIVGDQFGCPTYAQDIAKCIKAFIKKIELPSIFANPPTIALSSAYFLSPCKRTMLSNIFFI